MSAMLGSQTSPVRVQHFSHVNAFFGSNKFAYSCCPHELKCSIRWIALSNFGAAGAWFTGTTYNEPFSTVVELMTYSYPCPLIKKIYAP